LIEGIKRTAEESAVNHRNDWFIPIRVKIAKRCHRSALTQALALNIPIRQPYEKDFVFRAKFDGVLFILQIMILE
jgi:hypothetical protein